MAGDRSSQLLYPLYLDVPMMISFLAALEDGVSYEENIHRRTGSRKAALAEGSAKVGLPSLLGLLPFDLRGKLAGDYSSETAEELQLVKRHTEASLFNKLRSTLIESDQVADLEAGWEDDGVTLGQIIEATGTVTRNPLEELITIVERLRTIIEPSVTGSSSRGPNNAKRRESGGSPQKVPTASAGGQSPEPDVFTIVQWIKEDLGSADMTDIVLRSGGSSLPTCILTLSDEYGTGRTIDSLLGSQVTVLGKVSGVFDEGVSVNLLRRSVLGYMPDENIEEMFSGFAENPLLGNVTKNLIIEPPTIQILPLAIYV